MTKDEALKQLREVHAIQGRDGCWDIDDYMLGLYNGLELALSIAENRECRYKQRSKSQPEQDNTYMYASSLATSIWQKHYIKESPKFALLDTTEGVLTQIDNMTCGLVREKPAQPDQEPVKNWIASHNAICALLRQAHDALALTSYPPQPKKEPVAFASHGVINWIADKQFQHEADLYTTPPQHESTCAECDKNQSDGWALYCVDCLREFYKHDPTNKRTWVGLTDDEIYKIAVTLEGEHWKKIADAIQNKLKEKNI